MRKMEKSDNSSDENFLNTDGVKKELKQPLYKPNEILKAFIYVQHKSNINRFARELGVSRQYIWGIISGRLRVSMPIARKICDLLDVEDTRLIFPDGSIEYPSFKTADMILQEKTTGEHRPVKHQAEASINEESKNG